MKPDREKNSNQVEADSISMESVFKDEGISMPFESPVKDEVEPPGHHVREGSVQAEDTKCGCPQCCYCKAVFVMSTSDDTGNETQKGTPVGEEVVRTADKQTQILALPQQQRQAAAAARRKMALKKSPTHKLWMPKFGSIETFV